MIQILLETTQDLNEFKENFNIQFVKVPEMLENNYLLIIPTIEDWNELHIELTKGDLEVVGIWNYEGEILTDENVKWKEPKDKKNKKEAKNKFKKTKYHSKLKKVKKIKDGVEIEEDVPLDMQVNRFLGWKIRNINEEEL